MPNSNPNIYLARLTFSKNNPSESFLKLTPVIAWQVPNMNISPIPRPIVGERGEDKGVYFYCNDDSWFDTAESECGTGKSALVKYLHEKIESEGE